MRRPFKTTVAMSLVILRTAWTLNPSSYSIGCKVPVLLWTPRIPSLRSRSSRNSWEKSVFSALAMSLTDIVQDYMRIPDKSILSAVEKAGYRALPQDIAELAGVNLVTAQRDDGSISTTILTCDTFSLLPQTSLQSLAALTGGDLEVSKDGCLVFNFPRDFRVKLATGSIAGKAKAKFEKRSSEEDNRHSRTNFRPYYGYYSMPLNQRPTDPQTQSFIESVFSYVFGDGDQQKDRDRDRLKLIASVIRKNGGAVISEQLAPYLDAPSPKVNVAGSNTVVDESFVLPIVTALKGIPKVTEDGDIVYIFPELQKSAAAAAGTVPSGSMNRRWGNIFSSPIQVANSSFASLQSLFKYNNNPDVIPTYVKATPFTFSVSTNHNLILSGSLGIINLLGSLYLGVLFNRLSLGQSGVVLTGLPGATQVLYPFLLTYAVVFNVVPAIRAFKIKLVNARLDRFNEARQQWATLLASGESMALIRKLRSAKEYAKDLRLLDTRDVIYTTAKSLTEQYDPKDDPALAAFDRILES